MSLVGPKTHPVKLDDFFGQIIPSISERYRVKSRITGLALIRGYRGETQTLK
ncbi:MAG: putative colanic acid biosynthesis UDP-glucose lipid carrier transferase [Granulosicoccus sp.]|jgi:putative colanic acid biosynthesis UDP-glucose lipid carrier transferase